MKWKRVEDESPRIDSLVLAYRHNTSKPYATCKYENAITIYDTVFKPCFIDHATGDMVSGVTHWVYLSGPGPRALMRTALEAGTP